MTPPTDAEMTMGEVARSLARIESGQAQLGAEVARLTAGFVSQGEYAAWRDGLGREVRDLKVDMTALEARVDARRAPWWSVAAVLVAATALLAQVIPALAGG